MSTTKQPVSGPSVLPSGANTQGYKQTAPNGGCATCRRSYTLSNIRLDEYQRQELEAFYELFRRESVLYRHRANYPAEYVRFNKPPKYRDVIENGKVVYETTIELQRRK